MNTDWNALFRAFFGKWRFLLHALSTYKSIINIWTTRKFHPLHDRSAQQWGLHLLLYRKVRVNVRKIEHCSNCYKRHNCVNWPFHSSRLCIRSLRQLVQMGGRGGGGGGGGYHGNSGGGGWGRAACTHCLRWWGYNWGQTRKHVHGSDNDNSDIERPNVYSILCTKTS